MVESDIATAAFETGSESTRVVDSGAVDQPSLLCLRLSLSQSPRAHSDTAYLCPECKHLPPLAHVAAMTIAARQVFVEDRTAVTKKCLMQRVDAKMTALCSGVSEDSMETGLTC